ncbi:MAG TPA: hypothetical protein VFC63_06655 [Blastocatellia bacterium]|nr:hypothetical protein [Blastocatellia bacterium]
MKRHKFPALLVIVIFTAITVVSFDQFRPGVTANTANPVVSHPEQPASSNHQPTKLSQHKAASPASARALFNETETKKIATAGGQPGGLIALSKVEGTN